jgi:hypothetical protein
VAPSRAEVEAGVVFDEPDEHALVNRITTSSAKITTTNLFLITSPFATRFKLGEL